MTPRRYDIHKNSAGTFVFFKVSMVETHLLNRVKTRSNDPALKFTALHGAPLNPSSPLRVPQAGDTFVQHPLEDILMQSSTNQFA